MSGEITEVQSNGTHGYFRGERGNTGTVNSLTPESVEFFIKEIAECEGPYLDGNVCAALGPRNERAMYALDKSFETATGHEDRNPIDVIIKK